MFFNSSQAIFGVFFNDQTAAFIKKFHLFWLENAGTRVRVLVLKLFI